MSKEVKNRFWKAVMFSLLIVASIALFDISNANSGLFGNPEEYENGSYQDGVWEWFKIHSLFAFALLGIGYFFLIRKDLSESLAITLVPYITWMFGLADVLYFWFQGRAVPGTLSWLSNNSFISFFSDPVTSASLMISAIVGLLLALGLAWILKNKL